MPLPGTFLSAAITALGAAITLATATARVHAQGCEPIRFIAPVQLGGEGRAYQPRHEWELTLAYRRLISTEWFVGTKINSALAPGGKSPTFRIHTLVADVGYAVSERVRLSASLPLSTGTVSNFWPDGAVHEQHATGIGDLAMLAESWVLAPRQHEEGNVSVAVGIKAPTGSHTIASRYFAAGGAVPFPADQTIQPGDGGWAILLQSRSFRQVSDRTHVYGFGSYMVSPKAESDIQKVPGTGPFWSVPDVYSARVGGAYSVLPDRALTINLGGRIDGIPVHDLIGGGDATTIKRTSSVVYADPGLSLAIGGGTVTLSVPYRLSVNRKKSLFEQRTGALNAGGFAKYLVFAAYSYRL